MTIHLTPDQERPIQTVIRVKEVVEAALTSLEQPALPGFAGTPQELDALLRKVSRQSNSQKTSFGVR